MGVLRIVIPFPLERQLKCGKVIRHRRSMMRGLHRDYGLRPFDHRSSSLSRSVCLRDHRPALTPLDWFQVVDAAVRTRARPYPHDIYMAVLQSRSDCYRERTSRLLRVIANRWAIPQRHLAGAVLVERTAPAIIRDFLTNASELAASDCLCAGYRDGLESERFL